MVRNYIKLDLRCICGEPVARTYSSRSEHPLKYCSVECCLVDHIKKSSDDACWPWIGPTKEGGYGCFTFGDVKGLAHRIAYEKWTGKTIGTLFACHHCDNPPCCNPKHIFLGTPKENTQDMIRKGRKVCVPKKGVAHHKVILSEDDVRNIRRERASGVILRVLADKYGCSKATIDYVCLRGGWSHIV